MFRFRFSFVAGVSFVALACLSVLLTLPVADRVSWLGVTLLSVATIALGCCLYGIILAEKLGAWILGGYVLAGLLVLIVDAVIQPELPPPHFVARLFLLGIFSLPLGNIINLAWLRLLPPAPRAAAKCS